MSPHCLSMTFSHVSENPDKLLLLFSVLLNFLSFFTLFGGTHYFGFAWLHVSIPLPALPVSAWPCSVLYPACLCQFLLLPGSILSCVCLRLSLPTSAALLRKTSPRLSMSGRDKGLSTTRLSTYLRFGLICVWFG